MLYRLKPSLAASYCETINCKGPHIVSFLEGKKRDQYWLLKLFFLFALSLSVVITCLIRLHIIIKHYCGSFSSFGSTSIQLANGSLTRKVQWDCHMTKCKGTGNKCFIPYDAITYILLDVLLCSIAGYFYELCRILASNE